MNKAPETEKADELTQMVVAVALIAFSMVAGAFLLHIHVTEILSR